MAGEACALRTPLDLGRAGWQVGMRLQLSWPEGLPSTHLCLMRDGVLFQELEQLVE